MSRRLTVRSWRSRLPVFLPFMGKTYQAVLWVADWDHRLPSAKHHHAPLRLLRRSGQEGGGDSFGRTPGADSRPRHLPGIRCGLICRPCRLTRGVRGRRAGGGALKAFHLVSECGGPAPKSIPRWRAGRADCAAPHTTSQEIASQTRARRQALSGSGNRGMVSPQREWVPRAGAWMFGICAPSTAMVGEGTPFWLDLDEE